jgi:hypothetical protein
LKFFWDAKDEKNIPIPFLWNFVNKIVGEKTNSRNNSKIYEPKTPCPSPKPERVISSPKTESGTPGPKSKLGTTHHKTRNL